MPIRSMTGFGHSHTVWRDVHMPETQRITVEIRALNGRFLEVKVRQPFGPEIERQVRKRIEAQVGRGRVDVGIRCDRVGAEADVEAGDLVAFGVHPDRLARIGSTLATIRRSIVDAELEAGGVSPLELLRFLSTSNPTFDPAAVAPGAVTKLVDSALDQLVAMRVSEGGALSDELLSLLSELRNLHGKLVVRVAEELPRRTAALVERITGLCSAASASVDPTRVAQEVALLVARADVSEELARLASHFDQIRDVLTAESAAGQGKSLDFLAQELVREVTTLGSKVSDHQASGLVIEAKGVIERMREQVQNVE